MLVVRYLVLAAQAVWLGGMMAVGLIAAPASFRVLQAADPQHGRILAGMLVTDLLRQFHLVAYLCGGIVITGLFVMKFVGPPPAAFVLRVAIVAVMLGSAVYTGVPVTRELTAIEAGVSASGGELAAADPRHRRVDTLYRTAGTFMTVNVALGLLALFWYARD